MIIDYIYACCMWWMASATPHDKWRTHLPPPDKSAVAISTASMTMSGYATRVSWTNCFRAVWPATSSRPPPHMTSCNLALTSQAVVHSECPVANIYFEPSMAHCVTGGDESVCCVSCWFWKANRLNDLTSHLVNTIHSKNVFSCVTRGVPIGPEVEVLLDGIYHLLYPPVLWARIDSK